MGVRVRVGNGQSSQRPPRRATLCGLRCTGRRTAGLRHNAHRGGQPCLGRSLGVCLALCSHNAHRGGQPCLGWRDTVSTGARYSHNAHRGGQPCLGNMKNYIVALLVSQRPPRRATLFGSKSGGVMNSKSQRPPRRATLFGRHIRKGKMQVVSQRPPRRATLFGRQTPETC